LGVLAGGLTCQTRIGKGHRGPLAGAHTFPSVNPRSIPGRIMGADEQGGGGRSQKKKPYTGKGGVAPFWDSWPPRGPGLSRSMSFFQSGGAIGRNVTLTREGEEEGAWKRRRGKVVGRTGRARPRSCDHNSTSNKSAAGAPQLLYVDKGVATRETLTGTGGKWQWASPKRGAAGESGGCGAPRVLLGRLADIWPGAGRYTPRCGCCCRGGATGHRE